MKAYFVACCVIAGMFTLLFLGQPLAQAEDATVEISDEDLVKLHRMIEEPFPATDAMVPLDTTRTLRLLLEEGVDPYPFLRAVAFDPGVPQKKREKAIAWLGEMANPDTREQPDPRVVPCLRELLAVVLDDPTMRSPCLNYSHSIAVFLGRLFDALSYTKDEESVDLILPLTTSVYWNSESAPVLELPSHPSHTPEKVRETLIKSIRREGVSAIARSGTERALEIFATKYELDLSGLGIPPREQFLDSCLEKAIYRMAGDVMYLKDNQSHISEDKHRELEEIRQRVETRYLPLREKSTD